MSTLSKKDAEAGLVKGSDAGVELVKFDATAALRVIEALAQGHTLTSALKEPGTPSWTTFHKWLALYPELRTAYEAARELSAQALEDEALLLARDLAAPNNYTAGRTRQFEVAMGQLRWSAARRDPKRYGTRQETSTVIPIQINTTLDLGAGGANLAVRPGETPDAIYTLEAHVSGPDDTGDLVDDAFDLPEVPAATSVPRKPQGRPKGYSPPKPKHKTAKGIAVTVGNRETRAKRKAAEAEKE